MEPENWQQIEQIIDTALSMQKSERGKYVAKACKGDEQLRTKVTELLTSIETSRKENYLQGNAYHELKTDLPETIEQYSGKSLIGQKIDRYEIIDLIGHGGMGSVYLANRSDGAYEQKVALKLLRRGMDTPSNIARFERERQILAQLNHPNIAQLLDGGVTKDGLPYLIMEYVDGIPIHEFCNRHHLPVEDRLQLFRSVCNTVQYAHTNAVIHRDLKPSNILVTAEGNIKILDFGIAKLLEPKNPERVLFRTQTGARMLTIAYAAPEQVEAKPITTATDTYTLGILLFQLLTGVHPFDLENKDLNEIENVIRNQTPAKPSVRFSKLPDDKQNQILKNRGSSSSALIKKLGGDLDAIIMKALRKEAKARYISANNFWEDIRRANNNLPVIAREDTFRYKSKKFLKRHQSSLFTAAGFLILITAFVSFYTWQITQERDYAQTEAQKAEEVTKFLTNLIESNYPENAQGDTITVRAFLNRGFERVQQLDDSPAVKANIMQVMANTYRSLGELQKAHTLIDRVIQMHETWNFSSSETAEAYNKYGMIQRDRGNYEKAVEALETSIKNYRSIGKTNTKQFARLLRNIAYLKRINADYEEAFVLIQNALDIENNISDEPNPQLAETYYIMASILRGQEKFEQAKKYQLKSLQMIKAVVDGPHPGTANNFNNLAVIYSRQDSLNKAAAYYQKSLKMSTDLYGPNHPDIATAYNNLSTILLKQGELDSAHFYLDKALPIIRKTMGEKHPHMGNLLSSYADIFRFGKKYEKADSLYRSAFKILSRHYEKDHPDIVGVIDNRAMNAHAKGNIDDAERLFRKVLEIRKGEHAPSSKAIQIPLRHLTEILKAKKNNAAIDSLKSVYQVN